MEAFSAWLKMHTYVDCRDPNRKDDRIPSSLAKVDKGLGMGPKKFRENIFFQKCQKLMHDQKRFVHGGNH